LVQPRKIEISQLMKELPDMPEYHLYVELQQFNNSIYIFDRNFDELHKLIQFLTNDPRVNELYWLENRDKLQMFSREVSRLLHNFVAAAMSLIEHTRRLDEKLYRDRGRFPDYQKRVDKEFTHDPLARFVKDLRRYCQHRKLPILAFTSSLKSSKDRLTRTITLPREEIEAFDDWSADAKKYLNTIKDEVNILEVATSYRNKVIKFYEWFQLRQEEIHSEELKRFQQKEERLLLLMLEDNIDIYLANPGGIYKEREEVFLQLFSSREYEQLRSLPDHSRERPARAIELLEEHFIISDELKEKIYRLYKV
jgi:hypothetical protein